MTPERTDPTAIPNTWAADYNCGRTVVRAFGLQITVVCVDKDHADLHVEGEIDLANADALTVIIDRQLQRNRCRLRLDLSAVAFCDCSGLRAILRGHEHCVAANGSLTLTGVGPTLARMLRIAQLDEALIIEPHLDGRDVRLHPPTSLSRPS